MQVYGIDLSQEKFDVNFLNSNGIEKNIIVKNRLLDITRFIKSVPVDSVLCAEYTGVYGDLLLFIANLFSIDISFTPGYTIKHSLGMCKGKSDETDAKRIREYGERFYDKLMFKEFDAEFEHELKELYTYRAQLVKNLKGLQTSRQGRKTQVFQSIKVDHSTGKIIEEIKTQIVGIEEEIENIIFQNAIVKDNYDLIRSILGIGPVIATDLIIKTGNFKKIDTAKKAASFAAVCPFPNGSGKYIGKNKTSHLGDRKLKSLLYMGAKAAAKHNPVYNLYFKRKMLEGKPYFLIMNNISNKLLKTVYAVIESRKPYDINYQRNDPRNEKKVA